MASSPPTPSKPPDLSGRDRFGRNVASAWGGYMVNVISGFIVPRLISDQLGQSTLGIWDFCWSVVSYFGLVQLGMGGSVARYVAKFRAERNIEGLNRSVSTVALFLRSVGWLAAVAAVLVAWLVLPLLADRLGDDLETARWVVLFLGLQVAASITLTVYGSVIVGCHRWDLHNGVSAACYAVIAAGMMIALLAGSSLATLAGIHFGVMTAGELVRWKLSRGVCPELVIRNRFARWSTFTEQARYSFKSLAPRVATLLSNQALSILVTLFLGPASLAIFSRPRSLMAMMQTLAAKFGMILIPTASALQAQDDMAGLRKSLLQRSATISALVLPPMITLMILGDLLIRFWMGPEYVYPGLVMILSVGCLATLIKEPVWALLCGMNMHGKVALIKLAAACGTVVLLAIGLAFYDWGLLGAAVCLALPQLLVDGLLTPWFACSKVGASKRHYAWRTYALPLLCLAPYAIGLAIGVQVYQSNPLLAALIALGGTAVALPCYYRWLLPEPIARRLSRLSSRLRSRCSPSPCP